MRLAALAPRYFSLFRPPGCLVDAEGSPLNWLRGIAGPIAVWYEIARSGSASLVAEACLAPRLMIDTSTISHHDNARRSGEKTGCLNLLEWMRRGLLWRSRLVARAGIAMGRMWRRFGMVEGVRMNIGHAVAVVVAAAGSGGYTEHCTDTGGHSSEQRCSMAEARPS